MEALFNEYNVEVQTGNIDVDHLLTYMVGGAKLKGARNTASEARPPLSQTDTNLNISNRVYMKLDDKTDIVILAEAAVSDEIRSLPSLEFEIDGRTIARCCYLEGSGTASVTVGSLKEFCESLCA